MSDGEVKKVTLEDIKLVQNLIERCLQLYMSQKEVVSTLQHQAKIEPTFTEIVWQELEEANQDFFKAYYLSLILKDQILKFNKLLETHVALMRQISTPSVPVSNGSHLPPLHENQNPLCYAQDSTQANMHQSTIAEFPGQLSVNGSTLEASDVSENLVMTQDSNMGVMMQGMNGDGNHGMMKSESNYVHVDESGTTSYMSNNNSNNDNINNNVVEVDVPAIPSFSGEEVSNSNNVNEPWYGFLGQIPRNFSLSDLTADFSNCSDILDNYSGSPYLAADTDFWNPHCNLGDIQQTQEDNKWLDPVSEGSSYDGFGSDW